MVDGKHYAIPQVADVQTAVYNKVVLDALGIKEPPKTIDEFISYCNKAKAGGYIPLALRYDSNVIPTPVSYTHRVYPVIISRNLSRDTLDFIYIKQDLMMNLEQQSSYRRLYEKTMETVHPDNQEEYKRRFSPEALCHTLGRERSEVFLAVSYTHLGTNHSTL